MATFGVGNNPYIVPTNPPAIPQQMAPQPAQQTNTQPQTKCNAIWLHCTFDNGSEIPKEVLNYPKGPSEQLYFHDTDNPIIYMRETDQDGNIKSPIHRMDYTTKDLSFGPEAKFVTKEEHQQLFDLVKQMNDKLEQLLS